MVDAVGWRMKFGVIAPNTDTSVQPEFGAMRPPGVTNHFERTAFRTTRFGATATSPR